MTGDMIVLVLLGVGVGLAATVTMDVLGVFARRLGLAAGAKGIWVGRWYLGIGWALPDRNRAVSLLCRCCRPLVSECLE